MNIFQIKKRNVLFDCITFIKYRLSDYVPDEFFMYEIAISTDVSDVDNIH
ncbi:MAG: hypothetical protein ACRC5M_05490 [Anaeroplasmataceae bacterium]